VIDRRRLLGAGFGLACAAPLPAALARSTGVLTATDVHVDGYPTVEAVKWIGETLDRETGGRLRIRLYHSGQLGRESEAIDMARFGAIDITRVYSGALNNAFPLTQALCLPYVFDSVAHQRSMAMSARRCCAGSRRVAWSGWRSTTVVRAASTTPAGHCIRPPTCGG
jgi:TRAP-type C4-dicarboxylate transport system substrate-binding protein